MTLSYLVHLINQPYSLCFRDPTHLSLLCRVLHSSHLIWISQVLHLYAACRCPTNVLMIFLIFKLSFSKSENMLFQVLKNSPNVPETIFESMFALPQSSMDINSSLLEGNSPENPIHLPKIKADHFRVFLCTYIHCTSECF